MSPQGDLYEEQGRGTRSHGQAKNLGNRSIACNFSKIPVIRLTGHAGGHLILKWICLYGVRHGKLVTPLYRVRALQTFGCHGT